MYIQNITFVVCNDFQSKFEKFSWQYFISHVSESSVISKKNMLWSRLVCNSGISQVIEKIFWAVSHTQRLVLADNGLYLKNLIPLIELFYFLSFIPNRNKFIWSHTKRGLSLIVKKQRLLSQRKFQSRVCIQ